jgi:hypothetical protein
LKRGRPQPTGRPAPGGGCPLLAASPWKGLDRLPSFGVAKARKLAAGSTPPSSPAAGVAGLAKPAAGLTCRWLAAKQLAGWLAGSG